MTSSVDRDYIPPLRFRWLTGWYDAIVRVTTRERTRKQRLVSLAALKNGDRVLDLGCGTGTLTVALAASAPGACVVGLDADHEALDIARRKTEATRGAVFYNRGFAQRMPFAEGAFDVVASSLFFHHLNQGTKRAVLVEVRRLLKHQGMLFIADWGKPAGIISRTMFLLVQVLDGFETTRDSVEGTLPQLIRDAGFISIREEEPLMTPLGVMRFWSARAAP